LESHENLLISKERERKRSNRPYWWNGDNFAPRWYQENEMEHVISDRWTSVYRGSA